MRHGIIRVIAVLGLMLVTAYTMAGARQEAAATGDPAELRGTVTGILMTGAPARVQFLVDKLSAEHTGLRFEIEEVQFLQLDNKINLARASGADYDFIQVNHSSVPQFVNASVLHPLDDYIAGSNIEFKDNYNESFLALAFVDGAQYGIPWDVDCRVFAYNRNVLDRFGLTPPGNLAEMLEVARGVTGDGIYGTARNMQSPLGLVYDFGSYGLGMGARLYVRDGARYRATVDTPEMIEYVRWAKQMWEYMPKDVSLASDMVNELFMQDRLAMTVFGPWNFFNIGATLELGEDYALTTIPGDITSGSAMGGWMLGIGYGGTNKDGAWELMRRIFEPENLARTVWALPSDRRAYQYPPFNDPRYDVFDQQMRTAEIPQPPTPVLSQAAEVYNRYFNEAVLGNTTVEQAMRQANAEIQRLLDDM